MKTEPIHLSSCPAQGVETRSCPCWLREKASRAILQLQRGNRLARITVRLAEVQAELAAMYWEYLIGKGNSVKEGEHTWQGLIQELLGHFDNNQSSLARALGVGFQTVNFWSRGKRRPKANPSGDEIRERVRLLAVSCGIDVPGLKLEELGEQKTAPTEGPADFTGPEHCLFADSLDRCLSLAGEIAIQARGRGLADSSVCRSAGAAVVALEECRQALHHDWQRLGRSRSPYFQHPGKQGVTA